MGKNFTRTLQFKLILSVFQSKQVLFILTTSSFSCKVGRQEEKVVVGQGTNYSMGDGCYDIQVVRMMCQNFVFRRRRKKRKRRK